MGITALKAWLLLQIAIDELAAEAELAHPGAPPIDCAHQMIWQPARVMAECHAKREILRLAIEATPLAMGSPAPHESVNYIDAVVQVMAPPYADRAGFLEEWLPRRA